MNRMQHPTCNDVLRAPPDTPIEEVTPLAITRWQYADGTHAIATYWRPTEQELALIAAGHPVRLLNLGTFFPPVILGVEGDGVLPDLEGKIT